MKAATLRLCLPISAIAAQQTAISFVIPPFLDELKYPVSAIGSLVSIGPILALSARLPSGQAYRGDRVRLLMTAALSVMTLCAFLYSVAVEPAYFALVHALNGFAYGAATTIYLAFFVEALPPDEDRHHAMGYYAGFLAAGYSTGGFAAGYVADRLGYAATFGFASLLGLLCIGLLLTFAFAATPKDMADSRRSDSQPTFLQSLKNISSPQVAAVMVVALFLNLLHQIGSTFLPLYGLAVGLTLAEVGVIRGFYALCNAVTRPLSGMVVKRLHRKSLPYVGLFLQAFFLMLVPFFADLGTLLVLFILSGLLRAVLLVANTISLVEDVDRSRISRGMASGIFNAAGDVGNILGPTLGGLIATFTGIAYLFSVGPLITVALFFLSLWGCKFLRRV